jgi:hypothetical protein
MRRSQAILRLPVDSVTAKMILHDGERSDVLLFIAAGEDLTRLMSPGDPFVPMIKHARFCLVARTAIAAVGITEPAGADADSDGLPVERQRARVQLRSGVTLDGELRWTAPEGERRTADYVNDSPAFFLLHAIDGHTTYYIAKAQVATIEEMA